MSQQSQAIFTPGRQLTHAEKLRKVILELVDTERAYVEVRTASSVSIVGRVLMLLLSHPHFSSI